MARREAPACSHPVDARAARKETAAPRGAPFPHHAMRGRGSPAHPAPIKQHGCCRAPCLIGCRATSRRALDPHLFCY